MVVSPNSLCPLRSIHEELSGYLGNDMQREAFYTLYELENPIITNGNPELKKDWEKLQSVDHFYYMDTSQIFSDQRPVRFSPYSSPFKAFINYMNVLSDLKSRLTEEAKTKKQGSDPASLTDLSQVTKEIKAKMTIPKEEVFS